MRDFLSVKQLPIVSRAILPVYKQNRLDVSEGYL